MPQFLRSCSKHSGSSHYRHQPSGKGLAAAFGMSVFAAACFSVPSGQAQLLQGFQMQDASYQTAEAAPQVNDSDLSQIEAINLPNSEIESVFDPEWVPPPDTSAATAQNGLVLDPDTGDVFFTIRGGNAQAEQGGVARQPAEVVKEEIPPQNTNQQNTTAQYSQRQEAFRSAMGTGSLLFSGLSQPAVPLELKEIPAKPTNAVSYTLSPIERVRARAAWAYFENNRHPQTGFVSRVEGHRLGEHISVWDLASTFAAIQSARTLGLISKPEYDFQTRRLLASTAQIYRYHGLPTHTFGVEDGQPRTTRSLGVSAADMSYLLTWLAAVKHETPYLANAVDDLVANWAFCGLMDKQGRPQTYVDVAGVDVAGRPLSIPTAGIGKRAFADKGFALWGFQFRPDVQEGLQTRDLRLNGLQFVTQTDKQLQAEPFLMDGLLFEWDLADDFTTSNEVYSDGWRAEFAHRAYQVQFERYHRTGIITARGGLYRFLDNDELAYVQQPLLTQGLGFQNLGPDGLHLPDQGALSTKAAFMSWALWETPYTGLLFDAVGDSFDPDRGFPEGFDEGSGGRIDVYSLETNAAVLMALAYNHQGALIPRQAWTENDVWFQQRRKANLQESNCLPAPDARNTPALLASNLRAPDNPVQVDLETRLGRTRLVEQNYNTCGPQSPVPNLLFTQCASYGVPAPACSACVEQQAVTNCSFFEKVTPSFQSSASPTFNRLEFENVPLDACSFQY